MKLKKIVSLVALTVAATALSVSANARTGSGIGGGVKGDKKGSTVTNRKYVEKLKKAPGTKEAYEATKSEAAEISKGLGATKRDIEALLMVGKGSHRFEGVAKELKNPKLLKEINDPSSEIGRAKLNAVRDVVTMAIAMNKDGGINSRHNVNANAVAGMALKSLKFTTLETVIESSRIVAETVRIASAEKMSIEDAAKKAMGDKAEQIIKQCS